MCSGCSGRNKQSCARSAYAFTVSAAMVTSNKSKPSQNGLRQAGGPSNKISQPTVTCSDPEVVGPVHSLLCPPSGTKSLTATKKPTLLHLGSPLVSSCFDQRTNSSHLDAFLSLPLPFSTAESPSLDPSYLCPNNIEVFGWNSPEVPGKLQQSAIRFLTLHLPTFTHLNPLVQRRTQMPCLQKNLFFIPAI